MVKWSSVCKGNLHLTELIWVLIDLRNKGPERERERECRGWKAKNRDQKKRKANFEIWVSIDVIKADFVDKY